MSHKILIVDDDEATRVGLAALLTDAGYDTGTASDVPSAMQALAHEQPDLLIVDIRLEDYNGLQLIAMAPTPIPAIVVTGFADPALEADARRLGADYLLKPVSPHALLALIARKLPSVGDSVGDDGTFVQARRWPRRNVGAEVAVHIEQASARILDISYGGVGLEVQRVGSAGLPFSFSVTFPAAGVSVPVDVIWKRRRDDTTWLCGAAIAESAQPGWRELVDAIS